MSNANEVRNHYLNEWIRLACAWVIGCNVPSFSYSLKVVCWPGLGHVTNLKKKGLKNGPPSMSSILSKVILYLFIIVSVKVYSYKVI